jgi:hypothetical protein
MKIEMPIDLDISPVTLPFSKLNVADMDGGVRNGIDIIPTGITMDNNESGPGKTLHDVKRHNSSKWRWRRGE